MTWRPSLQLVYRLPYRARAQQIYLTATASSKCDVVQAMILAGGYGTRIHEEIVVRAKPLVEIGDMSTLWHIIKLYSSHAINHIELAGRTDGHELQRKSPTVKACGLMAACLSEPVRFARERLDDIPESDWNALVRHSRSENLYFDRLLLTAAMHAWPGMRPTTIITGRTGKRLVFLLPCRIVDTLFGRLFEILEIPTADRVEPLVAPEGRDRTLDAFRAYLLDVIRPDVLSARSLSRDFRDRLGMIRQDATFRQHTRPRGWALKLPQSTDAFWSSHSANFRGQLRRKLRRAEAAGLSFRTVTEALRPSSYDLSHAFENLTRLHRSRFESMNRRSFFLQRPFQAFHRHICDHAGSSVVVVSFTEALHEGRVIGSLYGLRTRDTFLYLMIGFDPAYAGFSPGSLLIYYTIEDLIQLGVGWFDFKCGDEPYKARWSSDSYEKFDLEIALTRRGRFLRLFHSAVGAFRRVRKNRFGTAPVVRGILPPSHRPELAVTGA